MTQTLLSADNISVRFRQGGRLSGRDIWALRGVTVALQPNEIVAVVGESGSGKSTLGRALSGLIQPTGGDIRFEGARLSKRTTRDVQMVLQNPFDALNPVHTIRHHVIRPLAIHHAGSRAEMNKRATALLEQVELTPPETYLDRHPHALSGGQRQRVLIARALAVGPRVLVADEPTSMLDVSVRADVLRLLERLRTEQGISVVLITHDLAAAALIADRIMVLKDGECVETGPTNDVLCRPSHEYTKALLDAIPTGRPGRLRM